MKKFLTKLPVLALLLAVFQLNAQTDNGGFIVRISGSATDWNEGECGWDGSSTWGGTIAEDFCTPVVWLYDNPGGGVDSLGCDTVLNDYTGKWVLIRRGVCEFGVKARDAQRAGAAGFIVLNHYTAAAENSCSTILMGPGAVGAEVTIPGIFASRTMGEALDAAVKAGNGQAEVCFVLPRLTEPYTTWHYATPVSQVDTISTMAIRFINRETSDLTGVVVKADIEDPSGNVTSLSTTIDIAAGLDSLVFFDNYLPVGGVGNYHVTFSNSYYTEGRDSVRTKFLVSQYSFGHDVVAIDAGGVGPTDAQFALANFVIQNAGVCITGPTAATATHATFGIGNVSVVATPDPSANLVNVLLYDADANDDGTIDLINSFDDLNNNGIIGVGEYTIDAALANDALVSVALSDLSGNPGVQLEARHPYYISLRYDGTLAGTGMSVRFANTLDYNYFGLTDDSGGAAPTTPLYLDQLYSGWGGAEVIERLELEGFTPGGGNINTKPTPLADSKFVITPNPADVYTKLDLNLDAVNAGVSVALVDFNGRTVQTQTAKNFQNGQFRFDTAKMPSGNYMMWITTAEGTAVRSVAICH